MATPHNLAKTALIANGAVWYGTALFLTGIAGEQTWNAFHGQGYNILGWAIVTAAAIAAATIGSIEIHRLRKGIRSR